MPFIKRLYGEYTLILLVLLISIGLSSWAAWEYQKNLQHQTVQEFTAAAQDRIELITDKIEHNHVVLRSVQSFFLSSNNVSADEFAIFTRQLLQDYPYIYTLEWIPQVTAVEREKFGRITEADEHGRLMPAERRAEYFPIAYAEPHANGNVEIIGFDIASDHERRQTLERARNERRMAATGRVRILQAGDKNVPGVIFYNPVFRTEKRADGREYDLMTGYIGSVVPLGAMIEDAIKPLNYAGVNIVIHDLSTMAADQKVLYVRSTRLKDIPTAEILADYQKQGPLIQSKVIDVGGREWQITILPAHGFYATGIERGSLLIFAGGMIFTLLLVFYMLSHLRENERIIREVDERTDELSKAKRETEMILLSTQEGVIGLDRDGTITFCNPTASFMLGYSKHDMTGQNHHALLHGRRADGTAYPVDQSPIHHVLEYGRACNVRDEVFWHKNGDALPVEYTGSPIVEGGEILGAVLVFRDVTERRALEKKLEQMARYDQLTGLANRGLFMDHLRTALARAERADWRVAVIYLDLNGFKPVNDTLGHAAGDLLLKKFAGVLAEIVRDSDVAARLGGDEFAILADNIGQDDDYLKLVERLRERLKKPFDIGGKSFAIGASIGIACYPDHAAAADDLVTAADTAMYAAKKDKERPWVIYSALEKES